MTKIQHAIRPPKEFDTMESACWFSITGSLLNDDRLYKEHLPEIKRLSRIEAQRMEILDNIGADLPRLFHQEPEWNPKYYMLLDPEKFNEKFEELLPRFETYRAAYEATEFLHSLAMGKTKYSSYDSFRGTRRKKIKAKGEK
jgi:hypothetical protein